MAAVEAFQAAKNLPANGTVDKGTWHALGINEPVVDVAPVALEGEVIIAPGANLAGKPIQELTLDYLKRMAGMLGKPITVTTGTNHDKFTVNGNVSDHFSGHAADLGMVANGGTNDGPVGDRLMNIALLAAGALGRRRDCQVGLGRPVHVHAREPADPVHLEDRRGRQPPQPRPRRRPARLRQAVELADLLPGLRLSWLVEPAGSQLEPDGVRITAGPATDWFIDPSGRSEPMLNAPALVGTTDGDFLLSARVAVEFASTFDAGVLVLFANWGSWAKLCFERSPLAQPMVVSVVTREVSDDCNSFVVDGDHVWLRVARIGAGVRVPRLDRRSGLGAHPPLRAPRRRQLARRLRGSIALGRRLHRVLHEHSLRGADAAGHPQRGVEPPPRTASIWPRFVRRARGLRDGRARTARPSHLRRRRSRSAWSTPSARRPRRRSRARSSRAGRRRRRRSRSG